MNLALFVAAAAVVWLAGTHTARYAEAIAEQTGIGKVFIGALLLGGITSLPEVATTVTAAAIGNAPLAVNNIFGGVTMQVAVLAVADAMAGKRALSAEITRPSLLLQGALLILLLALAAAIIVVGDRLVIGLGVGSTLILAASLLSFFLIQRHDPRETWEPEDQHDDAGGAEVSRKQEGVGKRGAGKPGEEKRSSNLDLPVRRAVLLTMASAAVILVGGFVLARTGDALAEQTGLGSSFVGAVLVAVSTSLPEVSTTLGAVRLGEYAMAVSNLFGANILDISILFLADAVYSGAPVLNEVGRFAVATIILGVLLTTVFLIGMLERRKRLVWRLGMDSIAAVVLYLGGIYLLYRMR